MITLAAICLNEEQFIGGWLDYHYNSFDKIILCEGAARNYPADAVTHDGLSSDRTASIIRKFPDPKNKINFHQYGWAGPRHSTDTRVPAKMELRNVYAAMISFGYAYTLDIDEFLHPDYVVALNELMDALPEVDALGIPQLHLWQDTSRFITGGYADISHYRLYRWRRGTRYRISHNWPSDRDDRVLTMRGAKRALVYERGVIQAPAIIHYGFCEDKGSMAEKNLYYMLRGESLTRPEITDFRRSALDNTVPDGCAVHEYQGFLPLTL